MQLEMPAISTGGLPDRETARYVENAYKTVDSGPRVGIIEERNTGKVPIHIDRKPPYAGVTQFEPVYTPHGMDVESVRVGISDSIPTYVKKGRKWINYKERVARHEFRHVLSEKLMKYMDVDRHRATLIMESYAEFGGIKGKTEDKEDVILTTPYTPAIKFGYFVDKFYKSEYGKTGYAAFVRDIQRYKSAHRTLRRLGANIKEAVDSGVDVAREAEAAYRKDALEALEKVDLKPKYVN